MVGGLFIFRQYYFFAFALIEIFFAFFSLDSRLFLSWCDD